MCVNPLCEDREVGGKGTCADACVFHMDQKGLACCGYYLDFRLEVCFYLFYSPATLILQHQNGLDHLLKLSRGYYSCHVVKLIKNTDHNCIAVFSWSVTRLSKITLRRSSVPLESA